VDDDATGLPLREETEHLTEDRAPALRGRLTFFEPLRDRERVPLGVARDGVVLFLERDSVFTLAGRGDADVGEDVVGNGCVKVISDLLTGSIVRIQGRLSKI
jgi:hypothetical protein